MVATLTCLTDVRAIDGDWEAFCFFFDELVPCVAGLKVWTAAEKSSNLISQAKKVVTVLDEAFTILALENYWPRWMGNEKALWTDSRQGNYQYMGWHDDAYARFDVLCNKINEQRQTESNRALERQYLAKARECQATLGNARNQRAGQLSRGVTIYNELDEEED